MNWYKIAQEVQQVNPNQQAFDFNNNDPGNMPIPYTPLLPGTNKYYGDCENLQEYIEEAKDQRELFHLLSFCNISPDEVVFDNGEKLLTIDYKDKIYVISGDGVTDPYSMELAEDWLRDVEWHDRVDYYITPKDFNKEFWDDVGEGFKVYHGTYEDKIESIKRKGLLPKDETRGLSNKYTGSAVFTSTNPDSSSVNSYDIVLEIDVGAMKRDGYMPEVSMEGPIADGENYNALAWKIGLRDYQYEVDSSDGLEEDTLIFYGTVPKKYITEIEKDN